MELEWLQTDGSPIVIIPQKYVYIWDGIENDYQYAYDASFDKYISKIEVKNHNVLVLGDESMMTTLYRFGIYNCIVRWRFAPSKKDIENTLLTLNINDIPIIEELNIQMPPDELLMFDSLEKFSNDLQHLEIHNNVLIHKIITRKYCSKNKEMSLIIHQLSE
ncbi:Imm21 family immunity protein [Parabacteroides johnsonii]|jgi:hypothetical protein|uniref:Imm21 family immunity protein n=1 Tax=Parabacteroides johnsonii TaxID=387661 RepID=UPI001898D762|nr:Imm21 family immunity protein [Parabacteroides johnsonii]